MARSDFFAAKGHSQSPITKKRPAFKSAFTSPAALPRRREVCRSSSVSDTTESDLESIAPSRTASPVSHPTFTAPPLVRSSTPRPSSPHNSHSTKSSNRRRRLPETTSIIAGKASEAGKQRIVKFKNFSESASDQTVEVKYIEAEIDPATGKPTGNKVMITKIVTMTMTTTVTVSKMLEEGEAGFAAPTAADQEMHESRCGCSCGHWQMHQEFHNGNHKSI